MISNFVIMNYVLEDMMKEKVIFVLKILFIVFLFFWIGFVVIDYFNARNSRDPRFCLKQEVRVYNEVGTLTKTYKMNEFNQLDDSEKQELSYTYVCVGLGYKIYRYHRDFHAIEFGPFFISERQSAK